ncbi:MAG: MBL fold metallo-hydrolase, partial [Candidatus Bathyarchaeia archaeon]
MRIKYLSHSGFELRNAKTILVDPYFTGNRLAPAYSGKPDLVLVTHEHYDHADLDFLSRLGSPVVCTPASSIKGGQTMRVGEKRSFDGVTVEMFRASHHQSRYPAGYVVEFDGKRVAHLGDMYLDGVKPLASIDVLLIPIGGTYTMTIDEAVKALGIIKPKLAIPMH